MSLRFVIFIGVLVLLDVYSVFGIKSVFSKSNFQATIIVGYIALAILSYVGFFTMIHYFEIRAINTTLTRNLLVGFCFSFIIFKLLFSLFLVFDDVLRVFQYFFQSIHKLFFGTNTKVDLNTRRNFLVTLGLGVASIPFASMLYGITKGKYNYTVKKITLKFSNLPKAFHGFKLVQISDIHSGSFDSKEDVQRGVAMINEQNADVVFFTGDLVNSDSREIEPYIDVFKSIKPEVYSILGNHDYGDYKKWNSKEEKKENFQLLHDFQDEMNFNLLKNENITLEKEGEKISVIGVENWGNSFVKHGDLDKALEGIDANDFKILLSHDPSHWDLKTVPHKTNVDLTLAGHTHGMQFGVDIPWLKWSPVKYKYPRWSGLYSEAKQYLYVNRGFGFLGFPGRVGMWPEITVIELQKDTENAS